MAKFKLWKPRTWFQASVSDSGAWSFFDLMSSATKSGVSVGPKSALGIPVLWSCVSVLSDAVSGLPLKVYDEKNGVRSITSDTSHDVRRILRPNQFVSMPDFIKFIMTNLCLSGNAFALIERNGQGEPVRFIPIQYNLVRVVVDEMGILGYEATIDNNPSPTPVSYENMLHFKINSLDGVIGLNPITHLAESLGISIAARDWASSFMKTGGWSGGYIIYKEFLNEEQKQKIKRDLPDIREGKSGSGNVGLLQGGPTVHPIGISPKDSQFIEVQQNQDDVISGAYRVPLWIINRMRSGSYVGSGLEQQIIAFLTFGVDPYLKIIETELNYKLYESVGNYSRFCEFTRQSMLQMDSAARSTYYTKALGGTGQQGYMSVNQVRKLENMPPLEGEEYDKVAVLQVGNHNQTQNTGV